MVSKPFKGYALAPSRRGTVFLVRGADKNSRIVFQAYPLFNDLLAAREILDRGAWQFVKICLLYTSPSPRDRQKSRMPSSA